MYKVIRMKHIAFTKPYAVDSNSSIVRVKIMSLTKLRHIIVGPQSVNRYLLTVFQNKDCFRFFIRFI
jgi:hypothetical protein